MGWDFYIPSFISNIGARILNVAAILTDGFDAELEERDQGQREAELSQAELRQLIKINKLTQRQGERWPGDLTWPLPGQIRKYFISSPSKYLLFYQLDGGSIESKNGISNASLQRKCFCKIGKLPEFFTIFHKKCWRKFYICPQVKYFQKVRWNNFVPGGKRRVRWLQPKTSGWFRLECYLRTICRPHFLFLKGYKNSSEDL